MKATTTVMVFLVVALPITVLSSNGAAAGPTTENALAAERGIVRALLANDVDAVGRLLADDWVVINTHGGVGDREGFLAAIKSGEFVRKTMDLSDTKVRIYGNVAVVTAQISTSGTLMDKMFHIQERSTDVLTWNDGGWKSVFSQETEIRKK